MSRAALVAAMLLRPAAALLAASGSLCAPKCGNVLTTTTPADLTCAESGYAVGAGAVFASCVGCELTSTYAGQNGGDYGRSQQADLQSLLYNLRYSMAYCVFGYPNNTNLGSSPCITDRACGPLQSALTFGGLAPNVSAYGYCSVWQEDQVPKCSACLLAGGQHYLNNFLVIADAGCRQQPPPGATLAVQGSPFSTTVVNITTPSSAVASAVPVANSSSFPLGAKVGVGVGAALVLLALVGVCIVCNGKRRRRAFLRRLESKTRAGGGGGGGGSSAWPASIVTRGADMFETPTSLRPLRSWEESPVSAATDKTFMSGGPGGFALSPYSSHYNSPVSAAATPIDSFAAAAAAWPPMRAPSDASARVGGELKRSPSSSSSPYSATTTAAPPLPLVSLSPVEKTAASLTDKTPVAATDEAYELRRFGLAQNVASPPADTPVLRHPGFGRGDRPPQYAGAPATDARAGQV